MLFASLTNEQFLIKESHKLKTNPIISNEIESPYLN